jgi:hypothetical protein
MADFHILVVNRWRGYCAVWEVRGMGQSIPMIVPSGPQQPRLKGEPLSDQT